MLLGPGLFICEMKRRRRGRRSRDFIAWVFEIVYSYYVYVANRVEINENGQR